MLEALLDTEPGGLMVFEYDGCAKLMRRTDLRVWDDSLGGLRYVKGRVPKLADMDFFCEPALPDEFESVADPVLAIRLAVMGHCIS